MRLLPLLCLRSLLWRQSIELLIAGLEVACWLIPFASRKTPYWNSPARSGARITGMFAVCSHLANTPNKRPLFVWVRLHRVILRRFALGCGGLRRADVRVAHGAPMGMGEDSIPPRCMSQMPRAMLSAIFHSPRLIFRSPVTLLTGRVRIRRPLAVMPRRSPFIRFSCTLFSTFHSVGAASS